MVSEPGGKVNRARFVGKICSRVHMRQAGPAIAVTIEAFREMLISLFENVEEFI